MKIVFIEPKSPGVHIYSHTPMPRLGTLILATILRDNGYDVEVQIEELGEIKRDSIRNADVVGISIITPTARRGYEIAKIAREEGKTVVIGGPHATYLPDEALSHADYIFRGEADESILPFVKALENRSGFEAVPGLSWRHGDETRHNKRPGYCKNLDALPSPDFNLITNATRRMSVTPIFTSRGCPFDCGFCSVSDMFGRQFRTKSTENILKDLRQHERMVADGKVLAGNDVFFYDDNFTINKKRVKVLLNAMIQEKLTPPWAAQASSDVADDEELLELISRTNCYYLYIGFESVNPATLTAYNKKHTLEKIQYSISRINAHGIKIHGMFVVGADTDDKEVIRRTAKFALRTKISTVQFMILTPLPGSRTYDEMAAENRITTRDWSLYDTHHVVFKPKNFTELELQVETARAMLKFYSWTNFINKVVEFSIHLKNVKLNFRQIILSVYGHYMVKGWLKSHKDWMALLSDRADDRNVVPKT